jgi:hypothetical protein
MIAAITLCLDIFLYHNFTSTIVEYNLNCPVLAIFKIVGMGYLVMFCQFLLCGIFGPTSICIIFLRKNKKFIMNFYFCVKIPEINDFYFNRFFILF